MRLLYLLSVLAIALVHAWPDPPCRAPPPAPGYKVNQVGFCRCSIHRSVIQHCL
jgi:hypothetical protein